MARTYLTPIQMGGNAVLGFRFENLAVAPGTPYGGGHSYYDTALAAWQYYDGTVWRNPRARADHTGTQLAATISNFAATAQSYSLNLFAAPTANVSFGGFKITGIGAATVAGDAADFAFVRNSRLDQFSAPTVAVPMNGQKLTGLGAPTVAGDSAEYSWVIGQVQSAAAGIASKPPVNAVATANVVLATNGLAAVGGYTPVDNDRILVVGQTANTENGVYNAHAAAWTRTTVDGAAPGEIEPGAMWLAVSGTAAGSQYRVATTGTIVLGTTPLSIVQFGAGQTYTQGNGITLTGSAFSVNPAASGGILVAAGGVSVDPAIVTRKFAQTIGDGTATAYVVTHNLNTQDVGFSMRLLATQAGVEVDWAATSVNAVTVTFATAPAANAYRTVIVG